MRSINLIEVLPLEKIMSTLKIGVFTPPLVDWRISPGPHLAGLVEDAMDESGFPLLCNLSELELAGLLPSGYPQNISFMQSRDLVVKVECFCRWLRAAKNYTALRRVIKGAQGRRSIGLPTPLVVHLWERASKCSRRLTGLPNPLVNLWEMAEKYPWPARLDRRLWAVKRRADFIAKGFELRDRGQASSWASIAQGLLANESTEKAAIAAVKQFS